MHLNVSGTTIDYLVLAYIAISLLIGYHRGVFARIYDFITTILVFVGAGMLAAPVSHNIKFYSGSSNIVDTLTAPLINTAVAFIICLIVLFLLKVLIGMILKPLFRHLKNSTHITRLIGGLLGMALSLLQSLAVSYIILALIIPLIYTNGREVIASTQYAHYIVDDLPDVTGLTLMTSDLNILDGHATISNRQVLDALLDVSLLGNRLNVISDVTMEDFIEKNFGDDIIHYGVKLNDQQRSQFVNLLNQTNIRITKREQILSKIEESD